jgi:hypothetical protein
MGARRQDLASVPVASSGPDVGSAGASGGRSATVQPEIEEVRIGVRLPFESVARAAGT